MEAEPALPIKAAGVWVHQAAYEIAPPRLPSHFACEAPPPQPSSSAHDGHAAAPPPPATLVQPPLANEIVPPRLPSHFACEAPPPQPSSSDGHAAAPPPPATLVPAIKTKAQVILRPVAKLRPAARRGDPCESSVDTMPAVVAASDISCTVVADSTDEESDTAVVAKARLMPKPPSCPPAWSLRGHSSLVNEVKAWQRRGLAYSHCWYRFVMDQGTSTFDPTCHTSETLSEFLSMVHSGDFELISAKAMPCSGEARAARILAAKGNGKLASDRSGRGKGRGAQNGTAEATSRPGAPPPKSTTPTRSCSRSRKRLSTPPRSPRRCGVRLQPPEPKSDPPTKSKVMDESDSDDWGQWTAAGMVDQWRD